MGRILLSILLMVMIGASECSKAFISCRLIDGSVSFYDDDEISRREFVFVC